MEILKLCAGIVITVLILVGVGGASAFLSWISDDLEAWPFFAFIFAGFGFGVCLTIILLQNGVIY